MASYEIRYDEDFLIFYNLGASFSKYRIVKQRFFKNYENIQINILTQTQKGAKIYTKDNEKGHRESPGVLLC